MNRKRLVHAVISWVAFLGFSIFFAGKLSWPSDWPFLLIAILLFLVAAIKTDECIDNEDILSKVFH